MMKSLISRQIINHQSNLSCPLRIGLVGAGAISQQAYLPELKTHEGVILTAIVDTDQAILDKISKVYSLAYIGSDLNKCLDIIDAAIIAIPNYLHFTTSYSLLSAGKHVLCEKPLTLTGDECRQLIDLADSRSLVLSVAHTRRYYPTAQRIKQIIDSEVYGSPVSFNIKEGTVFSWPTVSGFFFDRSKAGGGVLVDIGVHLLDLLLWWFPYEIVDLKYQDDSLGGVEAFAIIELHFSTGFQGSIKISRLSVLNNQCSLRFEHGDLEWNPMTPRKLFLRKSSIKRKTILNAENTSPVRNLLTDFINAIKQGRKPLVTGLEALASIQLIEQCYQSRQKLDLEWLNESVDKAL